MKPVITPDIGFDAEWATDDLDATRNIILSYQLAGRVPGKEWSQIYYTSEGAKLRGLTERQFPNPRPRLPLKLLLAAFIGEGVRRDILRQWPKSVIVAAHWSRADLAALQDYAILKRQFDSVHKTYVTVMRRMPYKARVRVSGHRREFNVYLVDTQLLAPGISKSLAALGELYQFPKINPGAKEVVRADGTIEHVPYIEHMDWLLADNPELYEQYAIRDAEISARHADEMRKFEAELGIWTGVPSPTLGSIAVKSLLTVWQRAGIAEHLVNGYQIEKSRWFDPYAGHYRTQRKRKPLDHFARYEALAKDAFHGGRNETFGYGPTGEATFREFDLNSAYPTALATIHMPVYENVRATADPEQFAPKVLGFARVHFRFPAATRVPSLPVRAAERGLIYPLEGTTYATAPEIAVARRQGATIDILDGVIIPWRGDDVRPFEVVIAELSKRRAQHPPGSLPNAMYKQLANSIYGKLGQGLKGAMGFNTRLDIHEEIGPSKITNPYLAAYVTGLIRALISELIASIPPWRHLISVTTDGFITDAEFHEIDVTGPVATYLGAVRRELTGDAALLEAKYEVEQLLPWRTRGIATLAPTTSPKLARGGMREPSRMSPVDTNNWFVKAMLLRQFGDEWSSRDPLAFPTAHRTNADHVLIEHKRAINFEYDMKRRPVDPSTCYVPVPAENDQVVQQLRFGTAPWRTVDEFNAYRDRFDQWRRGQGRQLKTIDDWHDWRAYDDGADAAKAGIRRSPKGPVDQARRLVLRTYVRRRWGLPGGGYQDAAKRLTAAGYPTTEQDLKNALRGSGELRENVFPADAPGIRDFIDAVLSIWPAFEWQRLVKSVDPD